MRSKGWSWPGGSFLQEENKPQSPNPVNSDCYSLNTAHRSRTLSLLFLQWWWWSHGSLMQGETGDDARRWRGGVPYMVSQLVELHTH
jgi:hypothetical protein